MKLPSLNTLIAASILALAVCLAGQAQADAASNASALALFPLASVAQAGSNAVGASVAVLPIALSGAGTLVVKGVNSTADGSVYVLERVADGAKVSVRVAGKAAGGASKAVGTVITVSTFTAGVLLSAAGDIIAFIPNAVGEALLHHERLNQ